MLKIILKLIQDKEKAITSHVEQTSLYYNKLIGYRDDGLSMAESEARAKALAVYTKRKEIEGEISVLNDKIATYQRAMDMGYMDSEDDKDQDASA